MNQKNIEDILQFGEHVGLAIPALVEVLRAGTARSYALEALGTAIPAEKAPHLQKLQLIDMDLFAEAVALVGYEAEAITRYAVAGATGLTAVAQLIERAVNG